MAKTLPSEIITKILTRLAVKDLLRYRCVSKPWCSLIDGPDFIKLHLDHSKRTNNNLNAVLFRDNNLAWVDLDALSPAVKLNHPIDDDRRVDVMGSCNGLLALSNSSNDIVFWNPSTKRYKKLPISNVNVSTSSARNLDFYGFGHDPVTDDYKLVKITFLAGNPFDSEVKVYSAKANSWKRINKAFPYFIDLKTQYGVYASNALHWFVAGKYPSHIPELVVGIDLVTGEYREIPLPEYDKADNSVFMFLDVLGGSLCLTCNYVKKTVSSYRVDIWVMKEYGVRDSWTKMFTVKPSKAIGTFLFVTPVAYLKSGEQVILNQECERFITYDLQRKKAKNLRISGLPERFRAQACVGSLVGLNGGWDGENESGKKKNTDQKQGNKKKDLNRKQRDDFLSKGFKLVL